MPGLSLPDSAVTLLVWAVPAFLLVLLAVSGILRFRRGRGPERDPAPDHPSVLVPSPDQERHAQPKWLWGSATGRGLQLLRSRIGVGIIVLAVVTWGTAALLYAGNATVERGVAAAATEWRQLPRTPMAVGADEPLESGVSTARDPETGERLILWAGDDQVGRPGRLLRESVAVVVQDAENRPVAGREVRFEVGAGGGEFESPSVRTGESGLALTFWRLGSDPDSLSGRVYLADRPAVSLEFSARLDTDTRSYALVDAMPLPPPASPPAGAGESRDEGPVGPTTAAPAEPAPFRAIAAPAPARRWAPGGVHTCQLTSEGAVTCRGPEVAASSAESALRSGVRRVAAGVLHVCGIMDRSAILCRAVGGGGEEAMAGERSLPEIEPEELAVGSEHVCLRSSAGRVYCWGNGARGQLGTGQYGDQREPARVMGVEGVVQLVSGWFHTCALTAAGQSYCWGANGAGQLGLDATDDRSRPDAVLQPAPFIRLTAGSAHTCGLTVQGDAWCWGENRYGQLGTGAAGRVGAPTRVETRLSFIEISAGGVHTCGLTESGAAWCWGRNHFGQLGNGSSIDSPIPVRVEVEHRFNALAAGGAHSCGETDDGALYCWGNNIQGQLGGGGRENQPTPVRSAGLQ